MDFGLKNINMLSKDAYDKIAEPALDELYVVSSSGFGFPSNNYDDLELGASGTAYIAPANGWFGVVKETGDVNQWVGLSNESSAGLQSFSWTPATGGGVHINLPAKKGDVVRVDYSATGALRMLRFIYAEGE